jgi:fused signal recognition particle receptor
MALFKEKKKGFLSGLFSAFSGGIDEDFLDELEEKLILADAGVETAELAVEELRKQKGLKGQEVRDKLVDILVEQMESAGTGTIDTSTKPSVILMVGVNGVGKTTTIGKLANYYGRQGKKVLLAAADTFRAAASEQLGIWAQRTGADIVRHGEGGDPGAVVFDACNAVKARGTDIMIVDTAGRLHNKQNLMNELTKITKVVSRELPDAAYEVLLVLDATTGQNGLLQAEQFAKAAGVTGIVLTKLDGTAKGGVVFSIAKSLGVPVKLVGVGEGAEDLQPFDAREFAEAMVQ